MFCEKIFIFGSKLFELPRRDAISCLPLELSWKIFLYLDDVSLRNASHTYKVWNRIIVAHKTLKSKLNFFELSLKLGSKRLARFYKSNKKLLRRVSRKNYLPVGEYHVESMKTIVTNAKRSGDGIRMRVKRFKID